MVRRQILKLNSGFFPLGIHRWEDIMVDIFSGAVRALDVHYAEREDGTLDESAVDYFNIIDSWKEWIQLPVRAVDDFVHTKNGPVRLPSMVVCDYNKVKYHRVQFPTRQNIFIRDKFTCGYTGKKLHKDELTVDHILPKSRGGQDTWENLITCDKTVNTFKDDRTPEECGLKLKWKPTKPNNGIENTITFRTMRDDWNIFIAPLLKS